MIDFILEIGELTLKIMIGATFLLTAITTIVVLFGCVFRYLEKRFIK